MAFRHAGGGDAAEFGLGAKLFDVFRAAITHAGAEPADELVDEIAQRPAVWHAAFHPFRHELAAIAHAGLAIAVARAGDHRSHRAHAAIALVAPALVDDQFAG